MRNPPAPARPSTRPPREKPGGTPTRRSWFCFLLLVVALLAADLVSKTLAFEHVGDRPIDLVATPDAANDELQRRWEAHGDAGLQRFVIAGPDPTGVLRTQPPRPFLPGLLDFRLTTNTGAVFGLGSGARPVFVAVSVLALGVVSWLFVASPPGAWVQHTGLALVLAGALGNLYDRIRFQAVRDLLHMFPGVDLPFGLSWPWMSGPGASEVWPWIFNLADVWLLAGVGLMLLTSLFVSQPPSPPVKAASSPPPSPPSSQPPGPPPAPPADRGSKPAQEPTVRGA